MKRILFVVAILLNGSILYAQNVGINTPTPQATLDVNGTTKTNSLTVATGGNKTDFLVKTDSSGQVGFKKGHAAVAGIRFIICTQGVFPFPGMNATGEGYIGEIRMFAIFDSTYIPNGWVLCEGQILPIASNTALYALLGGARFGGDGVTTFALPDLRGAAPLGSGNGWLYGQNNKQ